MTAADTGMDAPITTEPRNVCVLVVTNETQPAQVAKTAAERHATINGS
jgi:hypothetical protein